MATTQVEQKVNKVEERKDYVVFVSKTEKDKNGNDVNTFDYAEASSFEEMVKKGTVKAESEQFRQTVSFPLARTWAGIQEICPNEEEACNNFNRGAKSKGINRLKAILLDTDEEGNLTYPGSEQAAIGGVFDLTAEIASETKRKGLTVDEKLERFLDNLSVPDAVKESLRNTYKAAMAAGQTIPGME